jgi:3-dehydroquinate synthase
VRPQTVRVEFSGGAGLNRSYDITVGRNILGDLGQQLAAAGCRRAVLISDAAVAASHAKAVLSGLQAASLNTLTLTVPSGEASKAVSEAARLWEALAEAEVDRQTHIVAVGGGVVGDLAGFVAATYVRGLAVWQVPTTLVAQVDSAIGGKTGINLPIGKNLVGCFWQPRGVFSDIDTLATLPDRERRSGLAEVVKYGMIQDEAFFSWMEAHTVEINAADPAALHHIILTSSRHKAEVAAARLSCRLGRIDRELVQRQDRLLIALGLPINVSEVASGLSTDNLLSIMRRDKKAISGRLRFVLPTRLGHVELVDGISPSDVAAVLS